MPVVPGLIGSAHTADAIEGVRRFLLFAFEPRRLVVLGLPHANAVRLAKGVLDAEPRQLNDFLRLVLSGEIPPPTGWSIPTRKTERKPKYLQPAAPESHQAEEARFRSILASIRSGLKDAFGAGWSALAEDRYDNEAAQQDLINEVYVAWREAGGKGEPKPDELKRFVLDVRNKDRSAREHEVGFGEDIQKQRDQGPTPEEAASEKQGRAHGERVAGDVIGGRLQASLRSNDPAERTRAAVIGLHLGLPGIVPGQPGALQKRVRWYPGSPRGKKPAVIRPENRVETIPAGEADLRRFHPGGLGCPACRTIARFIRVPGIEPRTVTQIVDAFTVQLAKDLS